MIDGQTVQTAAGPVTLHTRIATTEQEASEGTVDIRFDNLGPIQRVAHGVATPSMVYFLLVLGLGMPRLRDSPSRGSGSRGSRAWGCWAWPPTGSGSCHRGGPGMALLLAAASGS